MIPIESPFIEEISGMAIVKIVDQGQKMLMMLKLKFIRNKATLDITNNMRETIIFDKKMSIGILDLRSLGYYKIKQGVLQQNLNKYYHFEKVDKICADFNRIMEEKRQEEKNGSEENYPWLDDADERKYMTDKEILDKYINLEDSCLDEKERKQVMEMLYDYKDVFSLRDEIGMCPNIEVNIEVTDNSPFFIRPYHVKEEDKAVLDKEMKRLCCLGILKEGFSAYSSPVMLISRKVTSDKRVVTDFRHLNMRIAKNNLAYPLLRDTFLLLGSSKCEVMSVLDLKDAFHSLQLSEKSQKYCGILPYFGSASYLYQRMPMGLNVSPPIWQTYINTILNSLQSRKYCEAIMDDLLLFTPSKKAHMDKLEDLLKALRKNGLKISPKKCQLFRTELQYMGNIIFVKESRVCMRPLHSRLEVIQKMKALLLLNNVKVLQAWLILSAYFCRQFVLGKEQQDAFEEIKRRLQKLPVLHMPDKVGQLYLDTSKYATGGALYQIQNGKPRLIAYSSKRLPEAAHNYSITELEMCRLAINIASFDHLLRKVDFDAVVDHLAIMQIMRSKVEPATNRIKRLLEVLSAYSFNLYYIKGKDMILSDFLSKQNLEDENTKEVIPISFNMKSVLQDRYYKVGKNKEKYMVQTRSQMKASGVQLPEVHGSRKRLDPHRIPEKQIQPTVGLDVDRNPRIGQGRAGVRRKAPPLLDLKQGASAPKPIVIDDEIESKRPISIMEIPRSDMVPPYLVQPLRPPPKPPDDLSKKQETKESLKIEIEENSPFQESIISEVYERPDKSYFQEPTELKDLINTNNIVQ